MLFIKRQTAILVCAAFAGVIGVSTAQAGTLVVYKLGVAATGSNAITSENGVNNTATGLTTPGDFGSNPSLTDDTTDYRNSWIDNTANWDSVTSINVGMYDGTGNEVAQFTFYGSDTVQGAGETLSDFFSPTYLSGSAYADLPPATYFTNDVGSGDFFSAQGDNTYLRQFFVNNNYGGCGNDTGWMVVNVGTFCGWETNENNAASGRAFLYALGATSENWNNDGFGNTPDDIGSADVFAVTVTSDLLNPTSTPEPATILTLGAALAGLGFFRRRRC